MTKYSLSWLAENSYEGTKQSPVQPCIPWNSDIYKNANPPSAKWDKFMSSDDEVKKFLHNYLLYGIAFVDDVPATVEATETVAKRVSLIRYEGLTVKRYSHETIFNISDLRQYSQAAQEMFVPVLLFLIRLCCLCY